ELRRGLRVAGLDRVQQKGDVGHRAISVEGLRLFHRTWVGPASLSRVVVGRAQATAAGVPRRLLASMTVRPGGVTGRVRARLPGERPRQALGVEAPCGGEELSGG